MRLHLIQQLFVFEISEGKAKRRLEPKHKLRGLGPGAAELPVTMEPDYITAQNQAHAVY